jgi:hypothetical protein
LERNASISQDSRLFDRALAVGEAWGMATAQRVRDGVIRPAISPNVDDLLFARFMKPVDHSDSQDDRFAFDWDVGSALAAAAEDSPRESGARRDH